MKFERSFEASGRKYITQPGFSLNPFLGILNNTNLYEKHKSFALLVPIRTQTFFFAKNKKTGEDEDRNIRYIIRRTE